MKSGITFRRLGLVFSLLASACLGLKAQLPLIPPTIARVTPPGVRRGSTATLTVEGRSLDGASKVLFDARGLTGKVLSVRDVPEEIIPARFSTAAPVPQGAKSETRLEVQIAPDVKAGTYRFRLQTPLGTSNAASLEVGGLREIPEAEPNDALAAGQRVELPTTLMGTLGWPGDVDSYSFQGKAGEEYVFQVVAASLGSELQSVLVLRDATGQELARAGEYSRQADAVLTAKLPMEGTYTISIEDLEKKGGTEYFYRLNAGALPYVQEVFPLGLRAGERAELGVRGVNLGGLEKVEVEAPAGAADWGRMPLQVKTPRGEALKKVMLAVGEEPEVMRSGGNDSVGRAQRVTLPVTINGKIKGRKKTEPADGDYYRFEARKGERLMIEVAAARLGSPLDSVVEVLDAKAHEIPRATIRCLVETSQTLADRDSKARGVRVASRMGIQENDYIMWGDELVQVSFVPEQPDADIMLKGYGEERAPLLNTSAQAHALNSPIYKAKIFEPGKEFPPNGLPIFHLTYRNDDGGPGYGQDSRMDFTAPDNGEYLLRIKDVRGPQDEDAAYRLTVRRVKQDFTLTAQPANPNVPRGGRVPVTVEADRMLGYDGPIELEVKGLPKGVAAKSETIPAGQDSAVILVEAAEGAAPGIEATPFEIVGKAYIGNRDVVKPADAGQSFRVVSVLPPPDLVVAAEPKEIVLEAGRTMAVTLHVQRRNKFQGRVPCNVLNLPPGVRVVNLGLNGVLVPEGETSRTFTLKAEDWAQPIEQPIYVVATAESNSPTFHASPPLILKVSSKQIASSGRTQVALREVK